MHKDGISVIITSFNNGIYLRELIDSFSKMKIEKEFEIILIDDCSTELLTINYLETLTLNKKVSIFRNKENKGVQYSRNIGISNACFSYILVVDGDDLLNAEFLIDGVSYIDYAVSILKEKNEIAFVHTYSYMFGDYSGYTISSYPLSEEMVINKHHVPTSIFFRKADLISKEPYALDILKWQDWAFGVYLMNCRMLKGKPNLIYCIEGPCHLYRIHRQGNRISELDISEFTMTKKVINKNPEIFKKYFPGNLDTDVITEILITRKPNRIEELLYIAKNDFKLALNIISERNGYFGPVILGVP